MSVCVLRRKRKERKEGKAVAVALPTTATYLPVPSLLAFGVPQGKRRGGAGAG